MRNKRDNFLTFLLCLNFTQMLIFCSFRNVPLERTAELTSAVSDTSFSEMIEEAAGQIVSAAGREATLDEALIRHPVTLEPREGCSRR